MFVKIERKRRCILIAYVDDIILTGDHGDEMSRIKLALDKEFEVKDLGSKIISWNGSCKVKERDLCILKKVHSGSS